MLRRALIGDYQRSGVAPTADDAYNFSMWRGYLSEPYHSEPLNWCKSAGASIAYIHTSGHASPGGFAGLCRRPPEDGCTGPWHQMGRGISRLRSGPPPRGRGNDGDPVTIMVVPKAALAPTSPSVGIFLAGAMKLPRGRNQGCRQ
jgi:hypothetical protein